MMKLTIRKYNIDERHIRNLNIVLLMPIIIDFFNVVINQFGLGSASAVTLIVYACSLIYIFLNIYKSIKVGDILLYFAVVCVFGLSYFLFPDTRNYLVDQNMLIVLFYFIPIGIFSTRKIRNWDSFWDNLYRSSVVAIVLALIIILFLDYQIYLIYMGFSYALLPFACAAYYYFRAFSKKVALLFFGISAVIIFIFGARAALLFLIAFVALLELFRSDRSIGFKIGSVTILVFQFWVVGANLLSIAGALSNIDMFSDSYILKNIISGQLLESRTRDALYEGCINRISTMGMSISGFFGDRAYCGIQPYPHNFFFEILMSYGWLFGSITIISFILVCLRCLFGKKKELRVIALLLIVGIFARYLISGSYIIEGKFWCMLFSLLALKDSMRDASCSSRWGNTQLIGEDMPDEKG